MGPWWHSCHRLRKECQPPPGEICQASWSHNAYESSAVALKPQVMEQCLLWSRLLEARSADPLDENVYPTNYLVQLDMIFFPNRTTWEGLNKAEGNGHFWTTERAQGRVSCSSKNRASHCTKHRCDLMHLKLSSLLAAQIWIYVPLTFFCIWLPLKMRSSHNQLCIFSLQCACFNDVLIINEASGPRYADVTNNSNYYDEIL